MGTQVQYIRVWPFDKAPQKYRDLSPFGGDEDWLAMVPKAIWEQYYIPFLDVPCFGVCDVDEHKLANGDVVVISCHA